MKKKSGVRNQESGVRSQESGVRSRRDALALSDSVPDPQVAQL
ncbi:MAG: hypothetical protein AAFX80_01400 [Cyanobacteria bacterium J06639_18]